MSSASRIPLLIASTLGLAAVVLLWSRPARLRGARAEEAAARVGEVRPPLDHPTRPELLARQVTRPSAEPARRLSGAVGADLRQDESRVTFSWVVPEGPAHRAGVRPGDRLLAVDGVAVRSLQEAEARLRGLPGAAVRLRVQHPSGEEQQLQLTLAD